MGFEYKIITKLTEEQENDLSKLFTGNVFFHKRYAYEGHDFFEFRKPSNPGKLPNIMIAFETDGIYICQYGTSHLWTDLEEIKGYLDENQITFKILDYSD